jgi:DNA-binding transcriptional ArsR family regulator
MMTRTLAAAVAVHKALAHPARLRILAMLRGGELCVCQITAVLGAATSTVSAHLAELRRAGLVEERKDGRFVHYGLATDSVTHRHLEAVWTELREDRAVAADATVLGRLRCIPVEELCRAERDLARFGIAEPVETRRT